MNDGMRRRIEVAKEWKVVQERKKEYDRSQRKIGSRKNMKI